MNAVSSASADVALTKTPARTSSTHLLYAGAAFLLLVATFLGFQQFYLHGRAFPGRELLPQARLLLIAHGVAMSGWIILFLVQTLLIVGANRRLHMTLGRIGAGLAVAMVALGWLVPVAVTRHGPEFPLWGLTRRQFMAIPLISITLFGAFVAIGVWNRRRPEIHRPMMLLATLAIVGAATDRIVAVHSLYAGTLWGRIFGPFFPALAFGAAFLVLKGLLTRSFDRTYAAGYAALAAACAMVMWVAPTEAWVRFASFLVG